jgi:hypothetical protein
MIKLTRIFIFGILFVNQVFSQNGEFKVYPNGLIYSEQAMSKLGKVVDSLNLKFKRCDLNKTFYAQHQVIGHLVRLDTGNIEAAKIDMERNMPFDVFCKKYPNAKIEKNVLIRRLKYMNYYNQQVIEIEHFDLDSDYGFSISSKDLTWYEKDFKGKWLFDNDNRINQKIESFYFPENFQLIALPKKYARMVGYSECLIDTATSVFHPDSKEGGLVILPKDWNKLPITKKIELLELMRNTEVVGGCSMDSSPREHAVNIALLSAETYKWEVFLKAHLDIMNDRFPRLSDGNYAWGNRKTYIKELEELNINVTDLMLGICLRVENPADKHYYGSIGRVGRAIAETKDNTAVEEAILAGITDQSLDTFNRLLFFFLFKTYNHHLKDETLKKQNSEKLKQASMSLPDSFSKRLNEKQ